MRPSLSVLISLLLGGGTIAAFLAFLLAPEPVSPVAALPSSHAPSQDQAIKPNLPSTARAEPPPANHLCGVATVQISVGAATTTDCPGPAITTQDGIVRRHRFRGVQNPEWFLTVTLTNGAPERLEAGQHGRIEFACDGSACRGITLGRPDANGVQTMRLRHTLLAAASGSGKTPLILDADLQGGYARIECPSESVSLNFSDNSYGGFCALGGSGSAYRDDGTWAHHFRNLDGDTLTIETNGSGQIVAITLNDGRYRCAKDCVGASMLRTASSGITEFRFFGTALAGILDNGQPGQVSLNGMLTLPPETN